ncbi:unnamed protein product, partial [Mesorhabditis belari]|uniref:Iron-binding zinc finger CDGSH type domain-containing protein n=1 Tax=Mesorhabditis belari TaxID=2138241 RepID=A0AAF3ETY8_9BILA
MTVSLTSRDFLKAGALVAGGVAIGYFIGTTISRRFPRLNYEIKLECDKVVDAIDVKDIERKKNGQLRTFCRCWKSKNWPYCDGAHKAHNKETGDNVGQLRILETSQEVKIS